MKTKEITIETTWEELYLDWVNNYPSIDKMAEDYGMDYVRMLRLLKEAKEIYEIKNKPQ